MLVASSKRSRSTRRQSQSPCIFHRQQDHSRGTKSTRTVHRDPSAICPLPSLNCPFVWLTPIQHSGSQTQSGNTGVPCYQQQQTPPSVVHDGISWVNSHTRLSVFSPNLKLNSLSVNELQCFQYETATRIHHLERMDK